MSKKITPARWAIDISLILNAVPDFKRFPVDVIEVATEISQLKFPDDPITLVKGRDLPGFEGAMKRAPAGKTGWGIFYNCSMRSKGRINFTLAHEFGHYLLHRADHPDGFMCSVEDMSRWGSHYAKLEAEANEFAANFLMPYDDFRKHISARTFPELEQLSESAARYEVSLMAAVLRWLSYTSRRAMMVVSCDGFIKWARSSESAFQSRLYIKTQDRPPVALPENSLANQRQEIWEVNASAEHDKNVWLNLPCREQVVFSDHYDFAISLLFFEDRNRMIHHVGEESEEDTFDRFSRRNPSQSWF